MKYVLVVLAVVFGVWLWRQRRRADPESTAAPPAPPSHPDPVQAMVACRHCGLHLPASDAIPGRLGGYCSADHRQAAEPT